MDQTRVLIVRINSFVELLNTRDSLQALRDSFPGASFFTLATPETETLDTLRDDPQFRGVLVFPPDSSQPKSLRAFTRFILKERFDLTVICFGATPEFRYGRHVLAGLFCPGKKILLDANGGMIPVCSAAGLRICSEKIAEALQTAAAQSFSRLLRAVRRPLEMRQQKNIARKWEQRPALQNIRRILWMPVDGLGDVVLSRPALDALLCAFPYAQVDVILRECYQDAMADFPNLHTLHTFEPPGKPVRTRPSATKWEILKLILRLRRRKYDLAVDVDGCNLYRFLAYASGAPVRVGPAQSLHDRKSPAWKWLDLLTHPVPMESEERQAVESGLSLMRQLGLATETASFCFSSAPSESVGSVLADLRVRRRFAIVHGASAVPDKQWNPAHFAEVVDYLVETHDLDVLLTGAPGDAAYNAAIRDRTARAAHVFNVAGRFSLREMPSVFQRAALMVTVDTGPMHIAAAVGLPIVALFRPGEEAIYHPYRQRDGILLPPQEELAKQLLSYSPDPSPTQLLDLISVDRVKDLIARKLALSEATKSPSALPVPVHRNDFHYAPGEASLKTTNS